MNSSRGSPPLQRGGFIQYAADSQGTIKSSIAFQFNPENLTRTIEIPQKPKGTAKREKDQAGDSPVEKITLTVQFSAADSLGANNSQARVYGIAPHLAVLQKMATPEGKTNKSQTKPVDKTGAAANGGKNSGKSPTQAIPRNTYPRILFVWGNSRILPVAIESMSIKEQQFDANLNPIQAEVTIGLAVYADEIAVRDKIAVGAKIYTDMMEQTKAAETLAQPGQKVSEIIKF